MTISYQPLSQRILRAHAKTSGNYDWLQSNWSKISKQYSDKFIAITDNEIVYVANNHKDLLKYISEHRDQPDLIGVHVRPNDRVLLR